ncbi:hypothetical protein CC80DRAFT_571561 [Byssothecium circinans]|uniref:Uncharacterized protein n=1 Tax=Byssothecium circinans TaxID=147558 RepID=A0A6A5TPP2_9PLEO|nr:hypothetical protein CC80DRAFT_571561 [Byssothecium circinans]
MGKNNTKTKHHCPGMNCWVGDVSPGGCRQVSLPGGINYCGKHEIPCRNGCKNWYHLLSQDGCLSCEARWMKEAANARKGKNAEREDATKVKDDDFFNPGKERKKPKKQHCPDSASLGWGFRQNL